MISSSLLGQGKGQLITHPWLIPGWEMIIGNPGIFGKGGGGGGGGVAGSSRSPILGSSRDGR